MVRSPERALRLHDDPKASARAAGLLYVTDTVTGFGRVRRGRGFSYHDERGRPLTAAQCGWARSLAIPPAWQQVWICPTQDGHLLATGLDDRGRKQYLYHPKWRELRDGLNFGRLAILGAGLPDLRAAVEAQLRRRTVDRERLLAGMVRLVDATGIRIGNESYERDNNSIGLTTLRWSHLVLGGPTTVLAFPAKSGRRAHLEVADRSLGRLLAQIAGPRRRRVFLHDGRPLHPEDVNEYLSRATGIHVTAKDFRTWRGTVTALSYFRSLPAGSRQTRSRVLKAIDAAADSLGNTRAVARSHYVHPGLVGAYLSGALSDLPSPTTTLSRMDPDEALLLQILPNLDPLAQKA